jgi:DNA-binding transcriptional MerR regulator
MRLNGGHCAALGVFVMPPRKKGVSSLKNSKKHYGISELSKEFKVTPRTIRHYEDEGLIEPARRGQTRLFTEEDRARLDMALLGKRLGIHLSKLRELFDLYDNAKGDDKRTRQLILLLSQQRQALHEQQADIERMHAELGRMEQSCKRVVDEPLPVKKARHQQDLFG